MRLFIVMFSVLVFCSVARAMELNESGALKCKNSIVSVGNTINDLISKCGQPSSVGYGSWFYDFGRNEFLYEIKIRNNRVYKIINTREYGKK